MTSLAFAASAGMLAAFNPCGFAPLPAYLVLFLGTPPTRGSTVRRALAVGAAVTVGFVAETKRGKLRESGRSKLEQFLCPLRAALRQAAIDRAA